MPEAQSWSCPPPEISAEKLLGVHKYKDVSKVRPVILKAANKSIEVAGTISQPKAYYVVRKIENLTDDTLSLDDGTVFTCGAFGERLAGSTALLVFVLTLGAELDQVVSKGFADGTDPLGPLFLDTAGWLTIEAATREFSGQMKEQFAHDGSRLTVRMAPGYDYRSKTGDERVPWDLADQQKLFGLFTASQLPVELLESGAMIPRMTRSGVFGIRPAE